MKATCELHSPRVRPIVEIRRAHSADITAIAAMSQRFAAQDLLLARTPAEFTGRVGEFIVAEIDRHVVGCAGLRTRDPGLLMDNLCVRPEWHGFGIGRRLVAACERIALDRELAYLVAASKHRGPWFERIGFTELTGGTAPPGWLLQAQAQRGSRLYLRLIGGVAPNRRVADEAE